MEAKEKTHDRNQDLAAGTDEFFSGISKDEKFIPVITLVVYCGMEHPWNGPKCLYDLLDIDDELKEYVSNYRLNLYDCHEHDTFDEYQTGLRQLFEVVRYGRDKRRLREIMEKNKEAYNKIDIDTRQLLEVVANYRIEREYENMGQEKTYSMLKAFADMKLEGVVQERLEHLIKVVCKKLQKDKPAEVIADELEEELSEVEKVIRAQQEAGSYDEKQIFKILAPQYEELV